MAVRPGNEEPVHRAWLSLGKRLLRILQRQAQGRMFERRDLLQPEGGPDGHRKLAQSLQYQAPTFCARISATGTAHHRANARPDSQYELVSQLAWYKISVRPAKLRYSRRGPQYLPELAAELVRLNVEVIQASGDNAPRIAQQVTGNIPILAFTDDILGAGLVSSLSRPDGNITGLTILAPELSAKRLEVLSEIVPGLSRVAALWDPTSGKSQVTMTENAARAKNMQLQVLEVRHRGDLTEALVAARNKQAQAINVFASPFLASVTGEIIGLAAAHRLPAIYQWKEQVENGGLVSYGPNLVLLWRQAGMIAAKLLKGAKPTDLPIEQPTKFELVINTRTAQSLGIKLPPSLLVRADDVID